MKLIKQLSVIFFVAAVFALVKFCMYEGVTVRLANNFSDATQIKMIDVKNFLPFNEESELVKIDTDFSVTGELPVLDGKKLTCPLKPMSWNMIRLIKKNG